MTSNVTLPSGRASAQALPATPRRLGVYDVAWELDTEGGPLAHRTRDRDIPPSSDRSAC